MYDGDDIGVHLTLNAEHPSYRWGPLTHAPSLLSGEGGFPRSIDDLWEHADPSEVLRECRAQIERAIAWGIDVTHLAPHLSAITLRPEFFDIYLELAVEFRLVHSLQMKAWSSPTTSTMTGAQVAAIVSSLQSIHCNQVSPKSTCSQPSTHQRFMH
jgi:predicted glycoside hydrolase/deacetylase ChbG (UPF0249 family)